MVVGNGPEDEAKERVKSSTKQREEVAHGWNDLCKDEAQDPDNGSDTNPQTPSNDSVRVLVVRVLEETLVDVLGCHVGVDCTDDDRWNNDECERSLLVGFLQRSKSRSSGVLTQVVEADHGGYSEEDQRRNCKGSEGFGEVLGTAQFRNECWEENLRHQEERNRKEGIVN